MGSSLSIAAPLSGKRAREAELLVTVKLGEDRYTPPFSMYLGVWRSQQQKSDKRAADLERDVLKHERALRDEGDRRSMNAPQCTRQQELQLRADLEQAREEQRRAVNNRSSAQRKLKEVQEQLTIETEKRKQLDAVVQGLKRAAKESAQEKEQAQKRIRKLEEQVEGREQRIRKLCAHESDLKGVQKSLEKESRQQSDALTTAQEQLDFQQAQLAVTEAQQEQLKGQLTELKQWQKERLPAPRRKEGEALKARQQRQRHQDSRGRLRLALQDPDLRAKDIAAALEEEGKVDVLFETEVLWERKMDFAQSIAETMNAAWDADFTCDFRDQFLTSQRDLDAMRFKLSHDIINGHPRPRLLISNPYHPRQKIPFAQPIRSRCEWVRRAKEREAAMQLIEHSEDKTCERDFDKSLDDLVARDTALLREVPFTAAKPLTFVVSFDGADNFTHVTLRLTDYRKGVAEESELKVKQLAVAMGNDHFPRLERVIAPRIGPAAAARRSVTLRGEQVPAEGTLCLDLSAARSAYSRRHGKLVHCKCTDVQAVFKATGNNVAAAFDALSRFCRPNTIRELEEDAHCPSQFPFRCKRPGCKHPLIKDAAHHAQLKAEKAALEADKTAKGKAALAAYIAAHADLHGQQRPFEPPVCKLEPMTHLIVDLLHGLDLNIPKVALKYSCMDPAILTPDMREALGDFYSTIGCPLDVREKEQRDASKKWFHGSVWHYDFVLGANRKSFGFQLCLIVYGVASPVATTSSPAPASTSKSAQTASKKHTAPAGERPLWTRRPYRHSPLATSPALLFLNLTDLSALDHARSTH